MIILFSACKKSIHEETTKQVYIKKDDKAYHLIRNGAPFFVKGGCGDNHLEDFVRAGGNTIRIYDTINLGAKLDELHKWGLAAVVDISLPKFNGGGQAFYSNVEKTAKLKQDITKFVEKYKSHPSLLFWVLGNETYYSELFSNDFVRVYNDLLRTLHEIDPDHPVTTTVSSSGLRKVPSILLKTPDLDFISINNFGSLHDFEYDKDLLFFWKKPYLISEWGIHGPWESNMTNWSAPIEWSSTEKAQRYRENYLNFIAPIDDGRFLGHMVFFWGQKQERTHSWFSLYTRDGKRTQGVFEIGKLFNKDSTKYSGPRIMEYSLEGKGGKDNILLNPNQKVKATVNFIDKDQVADSQIKWEIKPENWNIYPNENEEEPKTILAAIKDKDNSSFIFRTPNYPGPYRVYVEIEGSNGYVAMANIPFYVIGEVDE